MRRALLGLFAAIALVGCVSLFDDAYDDRARHECDRGSRAGERGACYDRVEQNRRERSERGQ